MGDDLLLSYGPFIFYRVGGTDPLSSSETFTLAPPCLFSDYLFLIGRVLIVGGG